ncbi:MAG: DUF3108 domain-containing protein [Candidatus Marinimicrobia bacterium]|nr:DUF3108 domain-containing protein [Candidatus Neomarinimicrobiota bacterium]
MKLIRLLLLVTLQLSLVLGNPAEEFHYVVHYFLLPGLEMKMKIFRDIEFEGEKYHRIDVSTRTKKIFDRIFAIDNFYSSVYHALNFHCHYFEKTIRQPNVEQHLTVRYTDHLAFYSTGETRPVENHIFDFFSMLMYLRTLDDEQFEKERIIIDMEGELFEVRFEILQEEDIKVAHHEVPTIKISLIYKKLNPLQPSVLDYTDIFFWKIAEEKGEKYIWIEKAELRRIIKARFAEGGRFLEAKLTEK